MQAPFTSTPSERSTYSAFFRAVNEDIMRLSGTTHAGPRQILCECSRRDCVKTVEITAAAYRAVRAKPTRFFVGPGHELPHLQRVVTRVGAALVVEESELCERSQPLNRALPIVLVVDDEPAVRELCATYLRESGLVVFEAIDGQHGLEQARSLSPDLVVTDVSMPVLDGFRLAEALRLDDRTQSVPLIFISGETDGPTERRALELGALAYFSKPFDPPALASVVTGVLARFAGANGDARRAVTPIRRSTRIPAGELPPAPAA